MTEKVREATIPWLAAPLAGIHLAVSVWALVASVRLLQRRRSSAAGFARAMLALGITEIAMLAFALVVQVRTQSIMAELFDRMRIGSAPGAPPEMEHFFQNAMQISVLMGIAFTIAWGVLKIVFAFFASHYAGRPEVRRYVAGA
jgi:hypothetical protein